MALNTPTFSKNTSSSSPVTQTKGFVRRNIHWILLLGAAAVFL